jgi:hypothetical protein
LVHLYQKYQIFGGLDIHCAWTGGEPKESTWKSSSNNRHIHIYCYRTGKDIQLHQACVHGVDLKLSFYSAEGVTLHSFSNDSKCHLKNHGMTAVSHGLDPDKKVYILIEYHALFVIEDVLSMIEDYKLHY